MNKVFATLVAASCSFGLAGATAQQSLTPQQLVGPITHAGTYDMALGAFTPSSPGDATPTALYSNKATNGSFFGPANLTNMDWGTPNFGGGGAVITEILIGYATTQTAGSPSLRIRLHSGATGSGVKGTEVLNILVPLAGLSPTGAATGFTQTVVLGAPLNLPEGALGWSYTSTLANTGPLLVGPPNAAGVINLIDQYNSTTGAYIGSGAFGTGGPMASFVMELVGRANTPPVTAWEKYGVGNGTVLTGTGPGTPGSNDNELYMKGIVNKKVILTIGITQSDLTTGAGLKLYAFPFVIVTGALQLQGLNGELTIPASIPATLTPGFEIFMQAFSQNVGNVFNKWSRGLKLTIQ
jgi:hypothetical protein